MKRRMPTTRRSVTHRVKILSKTEPCTACGHSEMITHKVFFWFGFFEDGSPGELFISCDQSGSALDGLADAVGIVTSVALQNGTPLSDIGKKMIHQKFLPAGITDNPEIPACDSVLDYIFKWARKEGIWNSDSTSRSSRPEITSVSDAAGSLSPDVAAAGCTKPTEPSFT